MSHPIINSTAHSLVRTLSGTATVENEFPAHDILASIKEHGLGTRLVSANSLSTQTDVDDLFASLGGAETSGNLNALQSFLNNLQGFADSLTQALFKERLAPYIQNDNRSVLAAFARRQNDSVGNMMGFITSFVHKDIKHPLRSLVNPDSNRPFDPGSYDHVFDPEINYSEEETGTYHTLIPVGQTHRVRTNSVYVEDTPLVRRYLRYIDHIASQYGIRVVYCPKTFGHREEIDAIARPNWTVRGGEMQRQYRGPNNYRALFVSVAFVYSAFSPFTRVETEVQPGQRERDADSMSYAPVMVEYTDAFVQVLKQLGAFSVCKIFYKASRTPARS